MWCELSAVQKAPKKGKAMYANDILELAKEITAAES